MTITYHTLKSVEKKS